MQAKSMIVAGLAALTPTSCAPAQEELAAIAAQFPFGSDVEAVAARAVELCDGIEQRSYDAAMAAPYDEQSQVNCHGYRFLGEARTVEFMINDGALGFYWILLDSDDLERARATLETHFSAPSCETARDAVFTDANVALRREPPEILVAARAEDFSAITGGC